jgi:hypothetical protein
MDDLAKQYMGRVRVAKFMIMTGYGTLPSTRIRDKYDINFVPIVVLFNRGIEVKRWTMIYMEDMYRDELDKVVRGRPVTPSPKAPAALAPAKSASAFGL